MLPRALFAATLVACANSGTTPPAVASPPASSAAPAPAPMGWPGTWSALSAGDQSGATVILGHDGRFRASLNTGPDERCCMMGTYAVKGDAMTFDVKKNSCKYDAFTSYTHIWRRKAPDSFVLAIPGEESHISETGGELIGPAWTFARESTKDDVGQIPECHS